MYLKALPRQTINHSLSELIEIVKLFFSSQILDGKYIKKFEKEFAECIGVKNAISVSSARLALYLILKNLDIKKGDEIILPAYTFHIMPNVVNLLGFKPVFVDINADTDNIDVNKIKKAITKRTKAIIPTHILGYPCDFDPILKIAKRYNLYVIEDCAHALGAEYNNKKVGSYGHINCFSFGTGKNMDCFGGGMITTNDDNLASSIRKEIENLGYPSKFKVLKKILFSYISFFLLKPVIFTIAIFPFLYLFALFKNDIIKSIMKEPEKLLISFPKGYFSKFTNVQAMIGLMHLKNIDGIIRKRRMDAEFFTNNLKNIKEIKIPFIPKKSKPAYLLYEVRSKHKDELRRNLIKMGIDTRNEYMPVCPTLKMFKKYRKKCPNAIMAAKESFELPISNVYTKKDLIRIINSLIRAVNLVRSS